MSMDESVVKEHGLSPEEFSRIKETLKREPNLLELGIFSVMWSEHCSYKSSRVYLKNFPTKGPRVLQGPGENAGVVDIGGGLAAAFKMESHNHPSFIEPYQGAATGVGGILRDIFTMGARPVASLNSLRFGSTDIPRTRALVEGVVSGIAGYGNCIGVPTVGGEVYFNPSYNGNCLVNVMTVGVMKKDKIFKGRASGVGNPVIYVGSRTGRDGIHGATMASDVFGEGGEERRPTVQVGDPFAEKLLLEACLELFKTDCIVGIQDMGAAGLTSSSVEMASRAGSGIELDMDRVPRREEGMTPYEIMLSESQERMLIVAHAGREEEVMAIFRKWDLEAEVIGRVRDDGHITILDKGAVCARLPIDALTDEAPVYTRPVERPAYQDELNRLDARSLPEPTDCNAVLLKLLSSLNIASKSWIYRQYDHMVRTDTVVLPGSDSAVIRVKGTDKALGATVDCNSRYCQLDPYTGGAIAVAEAKRNLAASGARAVALTDCLNFGSPERPDVMWQFREAIRGISSACASLEVPVIGGNVSFYNETSGTAVYPTPTIGMVGIIEDIRHVTTQWFKNSGSVVALIGETKDEIGGTEYLSVIHGLEKGMPPALDLDAEKRTVEACLGCIEAGIIESAHDVSDGGIAIALAEACMGADSMIGADIRLPEGVPVATRLFGETQSRIIVSLKEKDAPALKEICKRAGAPVAVIGKTGGERLRIDGVVDLKLTDMKEAWSTAFERYVNGR